ncbi:Hypothetical predicted protein [Mytilus galloprovincialis]|uniref:Uncharacterized protein n=1 Tax=Mytilus galloprovincialis TaxID=29158 RepID=A0A8B6D782_MYTGA|nr:Hypothetical predicted protein [Mytilus galloprovincialis]
MRSLTTSIHKIQATFNAKFLEFGNRLDLMESRDPPRPPRQLFEDDSVSLAPRSQEGNLLNDQGGISVVDSVVSTEEDVFIPKEPPSGNSDCLRSLVYSIRSDMSDMPMSSSHRVSSTPSDFMACSSIVKPESKGYYSFPESGHFTTALSFVNSSLAEHLANTSKTGGTWSLLKDKGEEFSDFRFMLLRVDKSLGMSEFLLLGTVANFTLAKRQEILDKPTVSEALRQRLVSSPLSKDKLFSVSLE